MLNINLSVVRRMMWSGMVILKWFSPSNQGNHLNVYSMVVAM